MKTQPSEDEILDAIASAKGSIENRVLLLNESAKLFISSKNVEFCRRLCCLALDLDPSNYSALFMRARANFKTGRYDCALKDLKKADSFGDNKSEHQRLYGDIHFYHGTLVDSIAAYSLAIELDPSNIAAWIGRGNSKFAKREYSEALVDFYTAIEMGHQSRDLFLRIAEAEILVGKFSVAKTRCDEAIAMDDDNGESYWIRARANLKMGKLAFALADVEKDLTLRPQNPDTHRLHGNVLGWLEQDEEAIKAFNRVLRLKKGDLDATRGRAICYYNLEKWEESLQDFEFLVSHGVHDATVTDSIAEIEEILAGLA